MKNRTTDAAGHRDLRTRAASKLTGDGQNAPEIALAAFGVLHGLASSPSTAADALALLHELQVHQVELDLQAEELRGSRTELEAALRRQIQLYDAAPAGYCTVDLAATLLEVNQTGASQLGCGRDMLLGQSLFAFLAPESARELQQVLASIREHPGPRVCSLHLAVPAAGSQTVHATVCADPAGGAFLVAWMAAGHGARAPGAHRRPDVA